MVLLTNNSFYVYNSKITNIKGKKMVQKQRRVQIRQQRIMRYFVEAAENIIKKDGITAITIRNVSELAGYTSATLYNYFDNLEHLIFLANIRYLENYNAKLYEYVKKCENSIEVYMAVCKCFCEHAYEKPEIFESLFFSHRDEKLEEYTQQYYDLFPENNTDTKTLKILHTISHTNNIHNRSFIMLQKCIDDGYIEEIHAKDFNDICLRFNKTILQDCKEGFLSKDEATKLTLRYYYQLFRFYLKPEHRILLDKYYEQMN